MAARLHWLRRIQKTMTKLKIAHCVSLASLMFLATSAGAAPADKMSGELGGQHTTRMVDVIVKYHSTPTAVQHQRVVELGGIYRGTHDIIQSASYRIPAEQLYELANDPTVEHVSLDHPVQALDVDATPLTSGVVAASAT